MQLLQILKGWLFIVLGAAALYLMALAMERRHGHLVAPPNAVVAPSQNPRSRDAEKIAAPAESTKPQDPLATDPLEESDTAIKEREPVAANDEPVPQDTVPALQPPEQATGTPEKQPASEDTGEKSPQPKTDDPDKPILPEATSFIDPEPEADGVDTTATPPVPDKEVDPQGSVPATSAELDCMLLMGSGGELVRATSYNTDSRMLLWEQRPGMAIHALTNGKVVRVFDSPFTGKTLYQQSENGKFCIVYGHLENLDPKIQTGARLSCNTSFATTESDGIGTDFSLQIMAIPQGGSWWQGQSAELTHLLPDWMPPEPEPEE